MRNNKRLGHSKQLDRRRWPAAATRPFQSRTYRSPEPTAAKAADQGRRQRPGRGRSELVTPRLTPARLEATLEEYLRAEVDLADRTNR